MCPRKILGVSFLDKIRNNRIRQSLDLNHTTIDRVNHKRMRIFVHVKRMNSTRYPKILMEANIAGKRPKGRPANCRWIDLDCIKVGCHAQNLTSIYQLARMAMDRDRPDGMAEWPTHADTLDQGRSRSKLFALSSVKILSLLQYACRKRHQLLIC